MDYNTGLTAIKNLTVSNIVEIRDLVFGYGDREILSGINMTFPKGKVVAIMGGSGLRKNHHIASDRRPADSEKAAMLLSTVKWYNRWKPLHYTDSDERWACCSSTVLFSLTCLKFLKNVALPLREQTDLPEELIHDLVLSDELNAVGLRNAAGLMPSEISGGMARRVALARAIALDPQLILYDRSFCRTGSHFNGCYSQPDPQAERCTPFDVRPGITRCDRILFHCQITCISFHQGKSSHTVLRLKMMESTDPYVHQFVHAETDGPVPFHYPGPSIAS